jgi:hypothetical protein
MTNPFVDEYIDTVAPSAEISLAETFGKKQIDFSADIVPSSLSQDTFTYALRNSEGTVVATGNVENGNNFVSVDVDGTYTLEVSGVDEAGNTFAWSKETVVKRTKVVLDIVTDYTYNPNGTSLEYSENVSGDYVIDFVYKLADKSATIEKLLNVGKYLVSYEVDAFEFVGEGELFMLRVHGDSMINAGILNEDYLVVRSQPDASNGEIVVALIEDEATVKRFYKENGHFRLQPENDYMEPIIVSDVKILGKVVSLLRKV